MSSFYNINNNNCGVQVGTIISFIGSVIPSGWLLCDGTAFSTLPNFGSGVYSTLISLLNGAANLPNLTDTRMIYGKTAINDAPNSDGANSLTLSTGNLPSHTHNVTISSVSHVHNLSDYSTTTTGGSADYGFSNTNTSTTGGSEDSGSNSATDSATDNHTHTITFNDMRASGGNTAPTNSPIDIINPYYTVKFIIKYI
jgi:microcystin-dependent protein